MRSKLYVSPHNNVILAVPMHECLEEHSCMSSLFLIALLNGIFLSFVCSLAYVILVVPMCECLREHSRMSSPYLIAIFNGNFAPSLED